MTRIAFLFVLLISVFSYSQDIEAYNKIYYKTYVETSQTDFNAAIKVADSLFNIAETPLLKTRSLMLSASLYKQSGDFKKSIEYALRSGDIIHQTDNYNWQAKVYGFLATEYRNLKLYDNSKRYMEKAFEVSKNIKEPKSANNVKGLMKQEKAYYEIEKGNYKKAIADINESQKYFELAEVNLDFFTANNQQLLGQSHFKLNDFDKAIKHYKSALSFCKEDPEGFLAGIIYNGLTQVYLEQKDFKNAKKYLMLAEKISNKTPYLQLKKETNTTSEKYYAATDDLKNLIVVKEKQDSVVEKINTQSTAFIDESFTSMKNEKKIVEDKNSEKTFILWFAVLFMISISIYFLIYRRKQRKNLDHFKQIIKNIELNATLEKDLQLKQDRTKTENLPDGKAESAMSMSPETEQKILVKLKEFEASELFRENTVSLATVATYCEVNSKYISFVINSYKKQDFNNYINELRIKYIVKKLMNFPLYRKYKIAVLAEESGFSSQNKFATIFKKVTTISPSVFIKYLQETEES